ncbi:MAG: rhodanese-like domain-containing protein [Acidobacteriota bacterium]|nr:rhodanese-like domain-containing protein [Acidobacteriota bacterium]
MIRSITTENLSLSIEQGGRDAEFPDRRIWIFDLRGADAYRSAHVPMAHHVPPAQALRWVPQRVEPHELVVLIDDDGRRGGAARHVAGELAHQWFRRLRYLDGGMAAWTSAGLPAEEGGPAGETAASECGKRLEFHRSGAVPWTTSSKSLPPDPGRVKFDLDDPAGPRES